MKAICVFCATVLLFCQPLKAQSAQSGLSLSQSSAQINWRIITNPFVRVVFPDYMEAAGNQVANLIEHYSHVVGLSYGIEKPQQITIILRPEMAEPNGFVTLAPRRSEWFSNGTLTPFIGGLDFNQALSIHEYRHVNQFDFLNRRMNRVLYYLFGEGILSLADNIGVTPWFFEGDAVWAETTKTDGGRGRSPRFSARLKALLTSDQIPSYDQIIGGTYNTVYPNHYVYGYFLVTRAYRLYGPDIWQRVLRRVTSFPLNPYLIYHAFRAETGKNFEDFYNETMAELAGAWQADFKERPVGGKNDYTVYDYPLVDEGKDYYLKKTLDSYWGLFTVDKDGARLVREFNIVPDDSRIDIKHGHLAFAQELPDSRFGYEGFSDLFVYDIAKDDLQRISEHKRLYHPQISPDGEKLLAIEYDSHNQWHLLIMDLAGNPVRQVAFAGQTIDEAVWRDEHTVFAVMQDLEGYKTIVKIDIAKQSYDVLMGRTRNGIYALFYADDHLYFEADDKGAVQIFRLSAASRNLERCTKEPIAAARPFVREKQMYYVSEVADGSKIVKTGVQCSAVAANSLVDFNYLGQGPADDFTKVKPVTIENYDAMVNKPNAPEEYNEWDRGVTPHSWSFFGGRGLQLQGNATNYLNTLNVQAAVGQDAEEGRPWESLQVAFMKYYPIFSLNLENRERKTKDDAKQTTYSWREETSTLGVTLPYIFTRGLFQGSHALSLGAGYLSTSAHGDAPSYDLSNDQLFTSSVGYSFEYLKRKRYREILTPLGVTFSGIYENDRAQRRADFSSWIRYGKISLFAPGIMTNHGMKFSLSDERRLGGDDRYRHKSFADQVNENVFSRGYDYNVVEHFTKGSYDYVLPLAYPDANGRGWVYLERVYLDLFFDHTQIDDAGGQNLLKSTGAEFLFDTNLLRKIPLTLGCRMIMRLSHDKGPKFEGFIATSSDF